jgi:hypothetical protein
MTTPRVVRFDWARFRDRVERLRAEHDARTPAEADAASVAAFKRWGETPPASFNNRAATPAGRTDDTPPARDEK